jgi:hypothetical protein
VILLLALVPFAAFVAILFPTRQTPTVLPDEEHRGVLAEWMVGK